MTSGRVLDVLHHYRGDVYHLAPVPIIRRRVEDADRDAWGERLVAAARDAYPDEISDVPDVRHVHTLGRPTGIDADTWSEDPPPAVGIWHNVPHNNFLNIVDDSVLRLRRLIEQTFRGALETLRLAENSTVRLGVSWIQFYRDGDHKVLHNHRRYDPPQVPNRWVGAYYVDPGDPDPTMPYSGVLSFRVQERNYFIRPRGGLLLIWPEDLLHEVHPFYGARERVVVNFHVMYDE